LTNVVIALAPVVAFLVLLWLMDRYRLVRPASVLAALAYGFVAAAAVQRLHGWLQAPDMPNAVVAMYIAPFTEETAKAVLVVTLVATARVGFLVDAAVSGFAVGTGFALFENLVYLLTYPDETAIVWLVRGLGTAMLHGGTTAIFAMLSKAYADRHRDWLGLAFLPGWTAAVGLHAMFNHQVLPMIAQVLALLIALPLLVLWVFARSERSTREWVGAGLDLDVELLALVASEGFVLTPYGRYLRELRARMPGPVVTDMFCLLRLELELSVQARAMLLAREAGLEVPVDEDLAASLAERRYLHESIGTLGLLALKPLQVTSYRDTWHRHVLRQGRRAAPNPKTRPIWRERR
jgi:RsiW-degrading membrane proteinase PrsW (M82 family)